MSKEPIVVGLDIGTYWTKVAVAKRLRDEQNPSVLALGVEPTSGVRKGVVVDIHDTVHSITEAFGIASKMIEDDIHSVVLAIDGAHLTARRVRGKVAVSRADGEVTEEDVDRVLKAAEQAPTSANRRIIEMIRTSFTLDEESGVKNPVGMSGIRLEVEALQIEGSASALKNLEKCVLDAGLSISHEVISPVASAEAVLDKRQKELGVAVVDIGAGTTSLAVYEEGKLIHLAVIPIGAGHITNDLAIALKAPIEVAEKVKLKYGYATPELVRGDINTVISLSKIASEETGECTRGFVAEVIEARLREIFDHVNEELHVIERDKMLPAGIVLTGGGANTRGVVDLGKEVLELPVKVGVPTGVEGSIADVDGPHFAALVGLLKLGFSDEEMIFENPSGGNRSGGEGGGVVGWFSNTIKMLIPE